MDLKRLRYFCTIVEQGQISRAAKVLNMSQPPLSQRLKELEEDLGTPLILREGGNWEVTEAGKILYTHAIKILEQLSGVRARVRDAVEGVGGQVNIGVSTACLSYVEGVIPQLQKQYPQLQFRIKVTDSNFLEKELRDKFLDLAVILLPLEEAIFAIQELPEDSFSVVFGKGISPPKSSPTVTLDDIAEYPLVLSRRWWGVGGYESIMGLMQAKGKRPHVVLDSQNIQALVRIMQQGILGVMLIPTSEVTSAMRKTFETRILVEEKLTLQPVIIYPKDRFMNRSVAIVIDAIVATSWKQKNKYSTT